MLCLTLALALAPDVLTVDDSGGADFTDLQPAIDAAQDGDLLLVKGGSYGAFDVAAKGIAIVADSEPVVTGPGVVRDLAPDQTVVLRGLHVVQPATATTTEPLLALENDLGVVVVEACHLDGPGSDAIFATAGLFVDGCAGVFVVESTVHGAVGSQFLVGPGPHGASHGIDARDSAVALHGCDVRGGDGSAGWFTDFDTGIPPVDGAAGASIEGGVLHAAGSTFAGGTGGAGADHPFGACWPAGDGGAGLVATDAAVQELESAFAGGAGGLASAAPCSDGADGPPLYASGSGSIGSLPAKAGGLVGAPPMREGQTTSLSVEAEAGALTVAFASLDAAFLPLGVVPGYAALGGAPFALGSAVVPAVGPAIFAAPVPELGLGVAHRVLFAQAVVLAPGAGPVLTGPAALVLLDAAR